MPSSGVQILRRMLKNQKGYSGVTKNVWHLETSGAQSSYISRGQLNGDLIMLYKKFLERKYEVLKGPET